MWDIRYFCCHYVLVMLQHSEDLVKVNSMAEQSILRGLGYSFSNHNPFPDRWHNCRVSWPRSTLAALGWGLCRDHIMLQISCKNFMVAGGKSHLWAWIEEREGWGGGSDSLGLHRGCVTCGQLKCPVWWLEMTWLLAEFLQVGWGWTWFPPVTHGHMKMSNLCLVSGIY